MRVRTITYFVALCPEDFVEDGTGLAAKLSGAKEALDLGEEKLIGLGYEVQTKRVTFNSFENWLDMESGLDVDARENVSDGNSLILHHLDIQLQRVDLNFCSLGEARSEIAMKMVPSIIHFSKRFNCSACIDSVGGKEGLPVGSRSVCPDEQTCLVAAKATKEIHRLEGDMGNFRFTVSFDCDGRTPFFPASFFDVARAAKAVKRSNIAYAKRMGLQPNKAEDGYAFNYSEGNRRDKTKSGKTTTVRIRDEDGNDLSSFRGMSVGLENGDLLFVSCFGADTCNEARDNLKSTLEQVMAPINKAMMEVCDAINERDKEADADTDTTVASLKLEWFGIDASINPGLSPVDSVAAGIESILFLDTSGGGGSNGVSGGGERPDEVTAMMAPSKTRDAEGGFDVCFGQFGTLAAVSAITGALKALQHEQNTLDMGESEGGNDGQRQDVRLVGYNGLMLPVMEDVVLAGRAAGRSINAGEQASGRSSYSLRDLLTFSSVCGVGLDTVPVPGNTTASQLAAVYTDTGALAYRLGKPLSCRLLPMTGLGAGDMTTVTPEQNPYLTNTCVFNII